MVTLSHDVTVYPSHVVVMYTQSCVAYPHVIHSIESLCVFILRDFIMPKFSAHAHIRYQTVVDVAVEVSDDDDYMRQGLPIREATVIMHVRHSLQLGVHICANVGNSALIVREVCIIMLYIDMHAHSAWARFIVHA